MSRVRRVPLKRFCSHAQTWSAGRALEQRPILVRKRRLLDRATGGLRPVVEVGQQVPAQLADLGSRQRLRGQGEIGDALVGRQLLPVALDLAAKALAQAAARAALRLDLRHDQAHQAPVVIEHGELLDQIALAVDRLDVLGKNVLAARDDDHLLAAADDEQIAVVVDAAEIAGAEEAVVGEALLGGLLVVPVAREHAGPARLDFAGAWLDIGLRLDPDIGVLDRLAHASPAARGPSG